MARLKLVYHPNEILRADNREVNFPLSTATRQLVDQMIFACKKFKGIGLAAPQIGKNLKLAIINLDRYEIPAFAVLNPEIIHSSKKTNKMEEGCLSIPGIFGSLERSESITVKFQNIDGRMIKTKLDGLAAKVFQHEIDHLDGKLILDIWDHSTVHKLTEKQKKQRRESLKLRN